MSDRKRDMTTGGFIHTHGGFATDDDGNMLHRVGHNSYVDDDGEIHRVHGFDDDDD